MPQPQMRPRPVVDDGLGVEQHPAMAQAIHLGLELRKRAPESRTTSEAELEAIAPSALVAALAAVSVDRARACAQRATESCFDLAFEPDGPRADELKKVALAGLMLRDRLASMAVVAELQANDDAKQRIEELCAAVDEVLVGELRHLTSLNVERRKALDALHPSDRDACYWWAARRECDGLVAAMADQAPPSFPEHRRRCTACEHDVASSGSVIALAMLTSPPGSGAAGADR